ncbi:ADP-ribosylation factor 1 [Iris pallida]|uniref:ADP-ribosylation factor 1 n=1 Tax=Iris pallida TaxID=29817 RepID=A0AAX6FYV1_IRIPA|nr:ADP-ribosylation factor 1 [Iris pallida]
MLQKSLISLVCIPSASATGSSRAHVPHLEKGCMRVWIGSQTT